jgi:phage terminase large subunit-like protein
VGSFDPTRAARVVAFVRTLKHTKGEWAGRPFQLQPWQQEIIEKLFGTINDEGFRQYRTGFIEIPRKNGKTELMAAIALYMLCGDGEYGADIYSAAAEREQAAIIFNAAADMVRTNRTLSARCKVNRSTKRIVYYPTNSFFQALSADADTKHGGNTHCVIYDELHAAPNRELWDVLKTSRGARRQPLMLAITTAGFDRNSICYEQYDYAKRNQVQKFDPTFYSFIREAEEDDDWKDEAVWKKANPNLEVSVKLSFLREEFTNAVNNPAYQNTFRRLYLNQWTQQNERWIDLDRWAQSAGTIPFEELSGKKAYAGLDLSSTTDLSAGVLVFPWSDKSLKIVPHFWIPKENLKERIDKDRVPYDAWVRDGFITATPGRVIDYGFILAWLKEQSKKFQIPQIAYDPWNATELVKNLLDEGFEMVEMRQGYATMSPASKEFYRVMLEGNLHHGNNPVLNWMAGNVSVKIDPAGNIKPDKSTSTARIDGIIGAIMGVDRALRNMGGGSVYENKEIELL